MRVRMRMDRRVTVTFVLASRSEACEYIARVTVECDGKGIPLSATINDGTVIPAELLERLAAAVCDLRRDAEPWDIRREVCAHHGYYPSEGNYRGCPECATEEPSDPR